MSGERKCLNVSDWSCSPWSLLSPSRPIFTRWPIFRHAVRSRLIRPGPSNLKIAAKVTKKVQARFAMPHQAAPASRLPSLMMPCPVCTGRVAYKRRHLIAPGVEDAVYACRRNDPHGGPSLKTRQCSPIRSAARYLGSQLRS
jgi:hypothetical protein